MKCYLCYFIIGGFKFTNGCPEHTALMAVLKDRINASLDETNKLKRRSEGLTNPFHKPGPYSDGIINAAKLLPWAWKQDLLKATYW